MKRPTPAITFLLALVAGSADCADPMGADELRVEIAASDRSGSIE